ncbi:unnamed protein product [Pleuronectes platessa]|uniref:Uncharacterized protein n=1 Tax=Pleuronectes platessa TaxID=8262 RepID=A0A9N7TQI4_PLEPL|nr:unnamed protein product [Pleuronectes platessa]
MNSTEDLKGQGAVVVVPSISFLHRESPLPLQTCAVVLTWDAKPLCCSTISSHSGPKRHSEGDGGSQGAGFTVNGTGNKPGALGAGSSWLDIRHCLKNPLTPSHTRVTETTMSLGARCIPTGLFHLSALVENLTVICIHNINKEMAQSKQALWNSV